MQSVSAKDNFYHKILKLVIPIIIQNLLSAAVSSADVVMLNYVGQSSISAVSLAANYASVLFMIYYGLGTGASMLSAQYWGKGDLQPIRARHRHAVFPCYLPRLLRLRLLCAGAYDEAFHQ